MANNMNLPRNADTAVGGKWINELIPKSMASIMQIAYVAIIPAPHHHPLRPVSCRRRNVIGIIRRYISQDIVSCVIALMIRTTSAVHQNSERRERPLN